MSNRIQQVFNQNPGKILNIYFTAGYPALDSAVEIARLLDKSGVDMIELGMPYSDPLADGKTIQECSKIALRNGMNIDLLFSQVQQIRERSDIPILLMGYLNQMMQYGEEKFCQACHDYGVDGLIIPDLPVPVYEKFYEALFNQYDLKTSFLITPQTSTPRVLKTAEKSSAFLYMVSQSSITGKEGVISEEQLNYFRRIERMKLKTPRLIGFGIHDKSSLQYAWKYANGAIIGSAFLRAISAKGSLEKNIHKFLNKLKP